MCIVGDPAVEQTNSEADVETFFELLRSIRDQPVYIRTPRRDDFIFLINNDFQADCSDRLVVRNAKIEI